MSCTTAHHQGAMKMDWSSLSCPFLIIIIHNCRRKIQNKTSCLKLQVAAALHITTRCQLLVIDHCVMSAVSYWLRSELSEFRSWTLFFLPLVFKSATCDETNLWNWVLTGDINSFDLDHRGALLISLIPVSEVSRQTFSLNAADVSGVVMLRFHVCPAGEERRHHAHVDCSLACFSIRRFYFWVHTGWDSAGVSDPVVSSRLGY